MRRFMSHVNIFSREREKELNVIVYNYRCSQKEISFKKRVQLKVISPFSMSGVASEYYMLYETLKNHNGGTQESHETLTYA